MFVRLLPTGGSGCTGLEEELFLGNARLTPKAADALRVARRQRAGKKQELTCMRREQAELLFERLEAAATAKHPLVKRAPLGANATGGAEPQEVAPPTRSANRLWGWFAKQAQEQAQVGPMHPAAKAHAAWLNDAAGFASTRAFLRAEMDRYWDRKSEGAFSQ